MRRRIGNLLRRGWLLAVVWACWLGWAAPALAKRSTEDAAPAKSTVTPWVLPYALVILGIALGMLVICRSSRRSDRAKPKGYEGLKTAE